MSLKGRVAQREYQNGLIWLLIDYFARFLREGHDKPHAARAETVERLPQDGRGWRPPAPTPLSRGHAWPAETTAATWFKRCATAGAFA
jgi:hypothetical protein